MSKSNIVLIGMPGAGKSTIGVLLAKALKMTFVDTDLLIQQSENRYLQDIINNDGIQRFLSIEQDTILRMDPENHVIATGGSVIYSAAAIEHLKKNGTLVYLKHNYDEIENRIKNITSRGIAMEKSQSLEDIYIERTPLYEQFADVVIDCSDKHMEGVISEIVRRQKFFN